MLHYWPRITKNPLNAIINKSPGLPAEAFFYHLGSIWHHLRPSETMNKIWAVPWRNFAFY